MTSVRFWSSLVMPGHCMAYPLMMSEQCAPLQPPLFLLQVHVLLAVRHHRLHDDDHCCCCASPLKVLLTSQHPLLDCNVLLLAGYLLGSWHHLPLKVRRRRRTV